MLAHQIKSDDQRPAVDALGRPPKPLAAAPDSAPRPHDDEPKEAARDERAEEEEPGGQVTTGSGRQRRGQEARPMATQVDSGAKLSTGEQQQQAVGSNELFEQGGERSRLNRRATRGQIELRLLVRRREAGALIGKRGANIRRLRQLFKESAFNIPDTGNGPERIVCVNTSSLDELGLILAELTQLFQEKQASQLASSRPFQQSIAVHPRSQAPSPGSSQHQQATERARGNCLSLPEARVVASDLIEVKLLVNASHAGLLIGVGGLSIRKLRNESKAAIKIYEMCCPLSSERVCAIKAKPPVVVSTIKMILEILSKNPIKCSHKPYDALNFDQSLADKYGGYAADDDCCPLPLGPPHSFSAVSSPSASSPLDQLVRQLQHQAGAAAAAATTTNTAEPATAFGPPFLLQNHTAQLLAAAAAAGNAGRLNPALFHHQPKPARLNAASLAAHNDGFSAAAAAALAAEKYHHSLVKAVGQQQALAAARYHPYSQAANNVAQFRHQLAAEQRRHGQAGGSSASSALSGLSRQTGDGGESAQHRCCSSCCPASSVPDKSNANSGANADGGSGQSSAAHARDQ